MSSDDKTNTDGANATNTPDKVVRLRPTRPCPICKKNSVQAFHPFCSVRCANIDLNQWLTGSYVIPTTDEELEEQALNLNDDET